MQVQVAARSNDEGRTFIEKLRRSKFMIGMALSKEAEEAAEGLRQDLSVEFHRNLTHLAQ